MGLFGKIDTTKKVNTPLLIGLTFIPFACCYSFVILKKFRKMFLINLAFISAFIVGLLILGMPTDKALHTYYDLSIWFNWVVLPTFDAILVWHWSTKHNQLIDQQHLTK